MREEEEKKKTFLTWRDVLK